MKVNCFYHSCRIYGYEPYYFSQSTQKVLDRLAGIILSKKENLSSLNIDLNLVKLIQAKTDSIIEKIDSRRKLIIEYSGDHYLNSEYFKFLEEQKNDSEIELDQSIVVIDQLLETVDSDLFYRSERYFYNFNYDDVISCRSEDRLNSIIEEINLRLQSLKFLNHDEKKIENSKSRAAKIFHLIEMQRHMIKGTSFKHPGSAKIFESLVKIKGIILKFIEDHETFSGVDQGIERSRIAIESMDQFTIFSSLEIKKIFKNIDSIKNGILWELEFHPLIISSMQMMSPEEWTKKVMEPFFEAIEIEKKQITHESRIYPW